MIERNIEVDGHDNIIGSRPRTDFYAGKYIHRSTYLILLNSKNEILIQKRASTKEWYPNLYTFAVARTVQEGESYEESMVRGLQEKIGITTPVRFLFKIFHEEKSDKAFRAIFIGRSDDEIKPNRNDISQVEWIDMNILKKDIIEHPEKYAPPFVVGMKRYFTHYGMGN